MASSQIAVARTRRRLQFGLLALFALVTLLALALGSWFYYRPFTVTVVVHFAVVDRNAASSIMTRHVPNSVGMSSYKWMILADDDLNSLFQFEENQTDLFGNGEAHIVDSWPNTTFVDAYHFVRPEIVQLSENHFAKLHESGELVGTLGSRRGGAEQQFRVDCKIECHHPNTEAMASWDDAKSNSVLKGKLFYEGTLPNAHLVFLGPIDDEAYSVVVFDVK